MEEPQCRAYFIWVFQGNFSPQGCWGVLPLEPGCPSIRLWVVMYSWKQRIFGFESFCTAWMRGGTGKGSKLSHVHVALNPKYLHVLKAASLQTDPTEGSASKHPQMKDHLYCSSVVAASQKTCQRMCRMYPFCQVLSAAADAAQEVPPKINTHVLCKSPGEQSVSPGCSQTANFPLFPGFVHKKA